MSTLAELCRCGCGSKLRPGRKYPSTFLRGHHRRLMIIRPITDRFWPKVDKSGECWLWTGSVHQNGYGNFALSGSRKNPQYSDAHRVAYELEVGPVPEGLFVCHHCDTRLCCRPQHLFVGTATDNMRDMIAKGRAGWQKRAAALAMAAD